MKKPVSSINRKFGFTRVISLAAIVLIAAVFISALPGVRAQAANSSSFFGLADLFSLATKVSPKVSSPQAILVSSNFDSGSFASEGWTEVNGTQANQWVVGGAAGSSSGTSSNAAYISDTGGTTYHYCTGTAPDTCTTPTSTVHFYRDVTFPAGETVINLTFDLKGIGESTFDRMRVYLVPTTTTPVAGTALATGQIGLTNYNGQVEYTKFGINIPASAAGTTQRLVFSWANDGTVGTQPPAAIDNIVLYSRAPGALGGNYTINSLAATGGTSFNNFNDAILELNSQGVSAPTNFSVTDGQTFSELTPVITATGTAANTITFAKSGAGTRPIVRATGGGGSTTTTTDALFTITGGDFITINGIDVQQVTATPSSNRFEYGYLVRNASATNGAQNNTIQNTSITLDRTNTSSIGIFQTASTTGGGFTPTAATGTNSTNKYYNFTIQNAYAGIQLLGNSSTTTFIPDTGNEVGTTGSLAGAANTVFNTIGGATAGDIGGGSTSTYGIRMQGQSNYRVFNNDIRNVQGTSTGTVDGIVIDYSASGAGTTSVGTNLINNNRIHDLSVIISTTAGRVTGIRESLTNSATSIIQVSNNFIWNLNSSSTVTTSRRIIGILSQDVGSGAASTHSIYFNSVRLEPTNLATPNSTFEIGTSTNINRVQNNIFANFTGTQTGSAKHYTWVTTAAAAIGGASSVSDYNVLYVNSTANGFVGLTSTTDRATLGDWQTATGQDANSKAQNPQFVSATDLHINPSVATPVESGGITISGITTDIDTETRGATPDIGADEGTFTALAANDIAAATIVAPANGTTLALGATTTPQATFTNVGTTVQTNVMVQFTITGPSGYSYSDTQTIATLNSGASTTVSFAAVPAFTTVGTYTTMATILTSDQNNTNNVITGSFTVVAPVAGAVNVGTGQTFTSLTNPGGIFDALNVAGATGNVTINITSDLTGETGSIGLNEIAGGFTVTIQPSGGATRLISGTNATALLNFNGADNVTIDGLNTGGNSLIIRNIGAGAAIRFINDASSNIVRNSQVEGSGGGTMINIATGTTTGNNNIQIVSNILRDQSSGGTATPFNSVGSTATSLTITNNNLLINNNQIFNFTQAGVFVGVGTTGITVTNNNIYQTAARTTALFGVVVNGAFGTNLFSQNQIHDLTTTVATTGMIFNDARGTTVSRNNIYNFPSTSGSTGTLTGIVSNGSSTGAALTSLTIVNNFVSIVPSFTNAQTIFGIEDFGFSGNIFTSNFNSVLIGGTASGTINSYACVRFFSAPTTYTSTNNICFNNRTGGTGNSFAAGDESRGMGTFTANYNIYVGTGATAANYFDLSTSSTATPVNFATWQAGTPTRDANSQASNPGGNYTAANLFISNTNLHLNTTGVNPAINAGINTAGVSVDYDGQTRDAMPDIGADEVVTTATPTIMVSATSLSDFGNVTVGGFSTSQNYTVSGSNLTAAIIVTAPSTDFQVSTDNTNFSNSVTVTQTGGTASATIYVRFSPQSPGVKSGNVTNASAGATTQNVAVSGTGVAANTAPTITATPSSQTITAGGMGVSTIAITDETPATVTLAGSSNNMTLVPNANIVFTGTGASQTLTVTPVAGQTGTAVITITATDSGGLTGTATYTLTVNAPTIMVAPTTLPNGVVGTAYNQTITATGGTANYTFAVTAGSLPTGLTLSSGGLLSGTPTAAATFSFTITATDANGFTGSRAYSVTINAGDMTAPVISYTPLPAKASQGTSTLNVNVTDNVAVQTVSITYAIGNGAPMTMNCTPNGGSSYLCMINENGANGQTISYYVSATDTSNNSSSLPAVNMPNGYAIGGTTVQSGTYTNLNINGGSLGGNVLVLGTFNFNDVLSENGNTLEIGCDGQIVRGSTTLSVIINGNVQKDLCAPQAFTFPVGNSTAVPTFAPDGTTPLAIYSPVTANVTAATNPSSLTVSVTDDFMPGSNTNSSVSRYWTLTEGGSITADLSFTYDQSDVNGNESTYKVIKNESGSTSIFNDSTNNATTNTATVLGISNFSLWSVGNLVPTAATADISGYVRNIHGRRLEYVNVTLSGGSLSEPLTVTTDITGRFHFLELPVNETYILSVRSKRYRFSQPTTVFTINGNLSNVTFISDN